MTTTTSTTLRWHKAPQGGYFADGEAHRYFARHTGRDWDLTVYRLEAFLDLRVRGDVVRGAWGETETLSFCKVIAQAFEDQGAERGLRSRWSLAIEAAYATDAR